MLNAECERLQLEAIARYEAKCRARDEREAIIYARGFTAALNRMVGGVASACSAIVSRRELD